MPTFRAVILQQKITTRKAGIMYIGATNIMPTFRVVILEQKKITARKAGIIYIGATCIMPAFWVVKTTEKFCS